MVGLGAPDDAAVWRLDDDRALVVTVDFFTPVVDDPYDYGAVAAANALSDVYAMGATPILALNVACLPPNLPEDVISEIIRGAAEKVLEAGAVVAGGHSIQDKEPKVGLVAVGLAHPDRLLTKAGAKPGDNLILTKPIGSGVTATALKSDQADPAHVRQMTDWMKTLNRRAAEVSVLLGARGATDVTGFSLLGHGSEMADASRVRLHLYAGSVPALVGARSYAERHLVPGGTYDNRLHFGPKITFEDTIDEVTQNSAFRCPDVGRLADCLERRPASRLPGGEPGGPSDRLGGRQSRAGRGDHGLEWKRPGCPITGC